MNTQLGLYTVGLYTHRGIGAGVSARGNHTKLRQIHYSLGICVKIIKSCDDI